MENAQTASQFYWIAWLATIPGVPTDWGKGDNAPSEARTALDDDPHDPYPPMLKAA